MILVDITPDTAALVEVLTAASPGQRLTYDQFSAAIGRDIRTCRHLLNSALRIAERDHGILFSAERGIGYWRLTQDQLPALAQGARRSIRRKSTRAATALRRGLAGVNDLPPELGRRINAELSLLGLLTHLAADKVAKPAPEHDQRPEPVAIIAARLFARPPPDP